MSCCFLSAPRGKNSSPQRQRGGGLPAPPTQKNKNYQLSAGLGGWAESAGLPSTSHPPTLSHRPPCTHALCARLHKTQYPLDTKCLCSRACDLWLMSCCFLSAPRGKNSSPQRQRGGGLPEPPPRTPEPASIPRKVKAWPSNHHNPAASNDWDVLKPKPARSVRTVAPGRDTFVPAGRHAIRIAPPASGQQTGTHPTRAVP